MTDTPEISPPPLPERLPSERLSARVDPRKLGFETTDDLDDFVEPLGQDRAVAAVRFGIGMKAEGFNMYCLGPEGTGKLDLVKRYLEQAAKDEPVPDDWVYVYNFKDRHKPQAIRLGPGRAETFRQGMEDLIDELKGSIPAVFEGEEYRARRQVIEDEVKEKHEKRFRELQQEAKEKSVAILRTPVGLALAPMKDGEVLGQEEFSELPEKEQLALKETMAELQDGVETLLREAPKLEKETRERIRELNREVTEYAVGHLIDALKQDFADIEEIGAYLDAVRSDVVDNVEEFREPGEDEGAEGLPAFLVQRQGRDDSWFRRYRVNVLVDNAEAEGAPVVYVDHPTQPNLIGRVEHRQQFGALLTDFNLIKSGALHRANGGYLVIDARNMLMLPFAYDDLKRALRAGEIKIEPPGQAYGFFSTTSLEPEPIPMALKVVLIGEPMIYYLLSNYDPDFDELFKVAADFDTRMDRDEGSLRQYARVLATVVRKNKLRPMGKDAIARVIEQSSRLADDTQKLSIHMASVTDLLREADYWAERNNKAVVSAHDVQQAIDAQRYRSDRIPKAMQEMTERDIVMIDTEGERAGQINGLAVYQLGRHAFGHPSRITARVRIGKGDVVDIERETDMGGPIHTKGVLILSAFLSARFAEDTPLSLHATLVFEQNYGGIDGDSASSTELYALLSALADAPIKQGLAVTGSVNQFGEVQAIGGVNEKIEGFFDLCDARGLTGDQGVLIPQSNVAHLMLKPEVVAAVEAGDFHIYPVEHIDQGIELLTGLPAGTRDDKGEWPAGSINRKVSARLSAFTRKALAFDKGRHGPGPAPRLLGERIERDDRDD